MTYDQHYQNGPPGPVAAINWVENVIKYTTKHFPANRVLMGIAAYGYDWTARSGKALTYTGIQNIIKSKGIQTRWHPTYQVPYFTYTKSGIKHEVWFENRNSTATKVRLATKYGLKGVAVWRLGYEDPGIWGVL
jgi:spore germination protein